MTNPGNNDLLQLLDKIKNNELLHCKSFAKLNLCLHILNRREDGYHNIQSIFQAVDLHDNITFEKNENNCINLETNDKSLTNEDNIIIKACKMLSQECNLDIGLNISLTKNIPIGSGLGGGSSNAAVTIHAINKLYDIQLSQGDLYCMRRESVQMSHFLLMEALLKYQEGAT